MKKLRLFLFYLLTIVAVNVGFSQVPPYYNSIDLTKTGNDLFNELSLKLKSTHSAIPYTGLPIDVWEACRRGDEDPDINSNVLLIYGYSNTDGNFSTDRTRLKTAKAGSTYIPGMWNREHVFAKSLAIPSLGTDEPGPGTDVYNLRAADQDRNSERGNNKFTDGSGNSKIISANGGWYPGDEWKGDVARIVMYMYTRYNGSGSQISQTKCLPINVGFGTTVAADPNMIDLFLKWNVEDPVSLFEATRNDKLFEIQGNRNPYVDNPYLATLVWGGLVAGDKWNLNGSNDNVAPSIPLNLVASTITDSSATISWSASSDNEGVFDYLIYVNNIYLKSTSSTSLNITNLNPNLEYSITIKARDASNNKSEFSLPLLFSTLVGPTIMFDEDFSNCSTIKFVAFNEASNKNWVCEAQFGENNSGSYGINGYQEDVLSKDWLITKNAIDFNSNTGEKLSFYTDAAYGNSPLELVYSSNYDGAGNPANFNWIPVPNVTIPIKSNTSSTEEIFKFTDVDISSINGSVYFAFKYYSNGVPTRWTVDNFKITADENDDVDGDGVLNVNDNCPNTPDGEAVNTTGCSIGQLDDDNDGVQNSLDNCANTLLGEAVNVYGCAQSQIDDDGDGVMNNVDICSNTPDGESVNTKGCAQSQLDSDNDGVKDNKDKCPNSTPGSTVDVNGCFTLSSTNFSIESTSETCPNKNNGKISITASATHSYVALIDGVNYNFSNNNLVVTNLAPKAYNVCISVTGESYQQCFIVNIANGTSISARTTVSAKEMLFNVEEGTPPFTVFINNHEVLSTTDASFSINNYKKGDLIALKSAIACEGVLLKTVDLLDGIYAYPNPTKGNFEVAISETDEEVYVEVFNMQSQLIAAKSYKVQNGKIQINIEEQPVGIYMLKIMLNQQSIILKLIKE